MRSAPSALLAAVACAAFLAGPVGPAGLVGAAHADPAEDSPTEGPVHLLYTFDECGEDASGCAQTVRDFSGRGNHGSVQLVSGGELAVVPGWSGSGVRPSGALIRLDTTASDAAFSPGSRAFSYGAMVKMDESPGAGGNLLQRGRYGPGRSQWKLQLDAGAGKQGCAVQGDGGRVTAFSPTDLPVDGQWHSVACVVTPLYLAYVVDGRVHLTPNTAGAITFPDTELLHVAGVFNRDGRINDSFRNPIDDVFFAS